MKEVGEFSWQFVRKKKEKNLQLAYLLVVNHHLELSNSIKSLSFRTLFVH